jgi:ATP-dependent DNA ligase
VEHLVIDGELVIRHDGGIDFDALQMRLHPAASRVRKLAAETPAEFIAFDLLLAPKPGVILDRPLSIRRKHLEDLSKRFLEGGAFSLSPATRDRSEAMKWLRGGKHTDTDGVIAKRLDRPYAPGERAMLKVKRIRTADCVVGGFRYASRERKVGSLLLGLCDEEGLLHHVGFTSALRERTGGPSPGSSKPLRRPKASPAVRRAARAGGAPSAAPNGNR